MCRLPKQKSNEANLSNLYSRQRVILEKPIMSKHTFHFSDQQVHLGDHTDQSKTTYQRVQCLVQLKINLSVQFQYLTST